MVLDILQNILLESWHILVESSPFMLFGFLAAGLLKAFVPTSLVVKHLGADKGAKGVVSVIKAAVVGAPLPLCSCSVLPAAAGIRDQGAGKGATTAFLVATPETGVDSIAVTYALLDPFMTVLRPIAAVLTAVLTGLGVDRFDKKERHILQDFNTKFADNAPTPCNDAKCSCHAAPQERQSLGTRLKAGLTYGFGEAIGHIGIWFLLGVLLAGIITALVPAGALESWLGGHWGMFAALVVAVPLYICATASTPLAAAFVLKGMSPGAALVLLLAGPATNAATITVVAKLLGRRAAIIYVGGIAISALALGYATDWLYHTLGLSTAHWMAGDAVEQLGIWGILAAALLLALIARATWMEWRHKHSGSSSCCSTKHCDCH